MLGIEIGHVPVIVKIRRRGESPIWFASIIYLHQKILSTRGNIDVWPQQQSTILWTFYNMLLVPWSIGGSKMCLFSAYFRWQDAKFASWSCLQDILRGSRTSKHKTFVYHLYNVGPTSKTLIQHCTNGIQMFCVWMNEWMNEILYSACIQPAAVQSAEHRE